MSSDSVKIVKVKVSPYPISVTFGTPPNVIRGRIVKLSLKGFLAEVDDSHITVQERLTAQFTLPVFGSSYSEAVVVVKAYNKLTAKTEKGAAVQRLIEFHFLGLKNVAEIEKFLRQIGQK